MIKIELVRDDGLQYVNRQSVLLIKKENECVLNCVA